MNRFVAVCIGLLVTSLASAVEPPSGSYQKHYDNKQVTGHWLILGAIERIKGAVTPELDLRVNGKVTQWLWQLPVGVSSEEAYEEIKLQIMNNSLGLYECVGRGCGPSNDFANQVFEQSILYGRESLQRYWAGLEKGTKPGDPSVVWVLYTTTRSNKKVYAFVEKILLDEGELSKFDDHLVKSKTKQLFSLGYHILVGAESQEGLSKAQINWIKSLSMDYPKVRFGFVAHMPVTKDPESAIEQSRSKAQQLLDQMAAANGFLKNFYIHGAGPMLPRAGAGAHRVELVVISR